MITTVGPRITPQPGRIDIPAGALVVLIGAAASGKSTFAARHFAAACVVSSDRLRAEMTDATSDDVVFAELHRLVQARLVAGLLTVVDATNTDWMWRGTLLTDAHRDGRPAIAIVFDLPLDICLARNTARSRTVPASVIRRQVGDVTRACDRLDLEGFAAVYVLRSVADVDAVALKIEEGPVTRTLDA